jgi:hypothetical protein
LSIEKGTKPSGVETGKEASAVDAGASEKVTPPQDEAVTDPGIPLEHSDQGIMATMVRELSQDARQGGVEQPAE